MLTKSELAIFGLQAVDMARSIRRLSGNIFIEGIPGYPLNVVVVLRYLTDDLAYNESAIEDPNVFKKTSHSVPD